MFFIKISYYELKNFVNIYQVRSVKISLRFNARYRLSSFFFFFMFPFSYFFYSSLCHFLFQLLLSSSLLFQFNFVDFLKYFCNKIEWITNSSRKIKNSKKEKQKQKSYLVYHVHVPILYNNVTIKNKYLFKELSKRKRSGPWLNYYTWKF